MITLLELLKHDKAEALQASKDKYPAIYEQTIQALSKKSVCIDLTIIEAINVLSLVGEESTGSYLLLRLSECFWPYGSKIELDYSQIKDVEIEDINTSQPYISRSTYFGREMTDYELELLNENTQYVYDTVLERKY